MSPLQPDYERRLTAYAHLTPCLWASLNQRQALPIMLVCLHDLRDADDLALRQAAAQALERFIEAACNMDAELTRPMTQQQPEQCGGAPPGSLSNKGLKRKGGGGVAIEASDVLPSGRTASSSGIPSTAPPAPEDPVDSPLRLLARMFYSQLKSQLGSTSLAVRQEHLTLMRLLATKLPTRFPDLALLASPEVLV